MRHFTINLVVNIIGAILFLVMGVALIVGFVLNQSIVEELQQVKLLVLLLLLLILLLLILLILLMIVVQAANFDNWNPFILCAGILALFTAAVFILGSWKVINLVMVIVMPLVTMMTLLMEKVVVALLISILIVFQEATLASGGKNKAVRDLYFLLAEDLVLVTILTILMHTETNIN